MKKSILNLLFASLIFTFIISGCKKDETRPNPTISFITDAGYTSGDVTLSAGDTIKVGFNCAWNGTDRLAKINQYYEDFLVGIATINPQADTAAVSTILTKSGEASEKYTFEIVDANGQAASVSLTLTKETTGGPISILKNITLGAQGNATDSSFFSCSNLLHYNLTDAAETANQALMDLLAAYDVENLLHLTSPGANLSTIPAYDFSAWTTKNNTYYCKMGISTDQYELIDSDKYIKDSFDGFLPDDQKRKAKELKKDDIYVFKTESGKYGILKVISVSTGETGWVKFDAKIQQ